MKYSDGTDFTADSFLCKRAATWAQQYMHNEVKALKQKITCSHYPTAAPHDKWLSICYLAFGLNTQNKMSKKKKNDATT